MGDYYPEWVAYLNSGPEIPEGGMLALFTDWADKNIANPAKAQKVITLYSQIQNRIVPVAQDRFVTAGGVYAYSTSIEDAVYMADHGACLSFSFESAPPASPSPPSGPESFLAKLATARVSDQDRDHAASAFSKLSAGSIDWKASFNHQASVMAGPLQSKERVGAKVYPPWFSTSALNLAFKTPGPSVWPAGLSPTWETTFGDNGNLRRLVTSVLPVEGVDVDVYTSADFTEAEQQALKNAASAGVTPLFSVATPADLANAGFRGPAARADGQQAESPAILTITALESGYRMCIKTQPGIAYLFGVVATPIGDIL